MNSDWELGVKKRRGRNRGATAATQLLAAVERWQQRRATCRASTRTPPVVAAGGGTAKGGKYLNEYRTPVSRSSVSPPPPVFTVPPVAGKIHRRPAAIRQTRLLGPASGSREPIPRISVQPCPPKLECATIFIKSGSLSVVVGRRRGAPACRCLPWSFGVSVCGL